MSKADKMFKDEGYTKYEDEYEIVYNINIMKIVFDKNDKNVTCGYSLDVESDVYALELDVADIIAINEKVIELGWLDEKE